MLSRLLSHNSHATPGAAATPPHAASHSPPHHTAPSNIPTHQWSAHTHGPNPFHQPSAHSVLAPPVPAAGPQSLIAEMGGTHAFNRSLCLRTRTGSRWFPVLLAGGIGLWAFAHARSEAREARVENTALRRALEVASASTSQLQSVQTPLEAGESTRKGYWGGRHSWGGRGKEEDSHQRMTTPAGGAEDSSRRI
jgi:hypothetical protein